jgi:FkbM family methyltransferase
MSAAKDQRLCELRKRNAQSLERHYDDFWARYDSGKWESHTRALLHETLRPGDLFVDVGAWIGPVSLWALELGAGVIAVEPDPLALTELRRRVPPSVEIWEGAVGVRPGKAQLGGSGKEGRAFGFSMSRLEEGGEIEVPTWTLTEILAGRRPALVKIDVEGHEIELLPQIAPYLATVQVPIHVALHGVLPDPRWFNGFSRVEIPSKPTGTVVARP